MRALLGVGLVAALLVLTFVRCVPRSNGGGAAVLAERPEQEVGSAEVLDRPAVQPEPEEARSSSESRGVAMTSSATAVPAPAAFDPVQCILHGRVRAEGARFASPETGYVVVTREGAQQLGPIGLEGRYSLAGLEPGLWSVEVQKSGYRQFATELELTLDEAIVRRDFELVPGWLLPVRVMTPAGEPYGEAMAERSRASGKRALLPMAVATKEPPAATIPGADDSNGYAADGVYHTWDNLGQAAGEAVLEVLAEPPVYVSLVLGETVLQTQRVEASAESVTFVLDPEASYETTATLTLRLVSGVDRRPIEQGDIWINQDSIHMVRGPEWRETFAPGRYDLVIRSHGYASVFLTVALAAGESADLGELELEPELTIAGRLVDSTGKPVVRALEIGQRNEQGRLRFVEDYRYSMADDGTFRIVGLARGQYVLRSAPERELEFTEGAPAPELWVLPPTWVSTLGGSVEGLQLTLVRAGVLALRGMSKWPEGSQCKLLDAGGDLAAYDGFYPGYTPRFALQPGSYTLVVCDREWLELRRFPVAIGAGVLELDVGE